MQKQCGRGMLFSPIIHSISCMILPLLYALISVIVVSLISLVGVITLSFKEQTIKKYVFVFVSLAIGALLGDAFLHIIGESIEETGNIEMVAFLVIAGIVLFFLIEKILHWHHHLEQGDEERHIHPVGKMILVSDGLHNLIDGLIIGAAYLVDIQLGIATTLAVILHEIPQEIGDFGVLLHAGYTVKKALWFNFLSALAAVAGVIIALFLGSITESFTLWLLPLAAGGFIYIAIADLVPELHKTKDWRNIILQVVMICVGVALMALLLLLE